MNYPAASSGVSKTTTGKTLRPKGRGIHPDGNKSFARAGLPLPPETDTESLIHGLIGEDTPHAGSGGR